MRTAAMDFRAAYDHIPCAVLVIRPDAEGLVEYANADGARAIDLPTVRDALGERCWRLYPAHAAGWEADCAAALSGSPIRDLHTYAGRWYDRSVVARPGGLVVVGMREVTAELRLHRIRYALTGEPPRQGLVGAVVQRPQNPVR